MRYFLFFTIFIFSSTLLNAEYLRSIRLGSFPTLETAQNSLFEVEEFLSQYPHILELKEQKSFVFKARASGSYYITLVEPFRDRKVLQEVLDTLRLSYPDIYVTKLKKAPKEQKVLDISVTASMKDERKIVEIFPESTEEKNEPIVVEQKTPDTTKNIANNITNIEKKIEIEEDVNKRVVKQSLTNESIPKYIFLIGLLLSIIIVVLAKFLLKYKKSNEVYLNKILIQSEKLEQALTDNGIKDKVLSHVSHELRTPMTAIMGLTHLVLESDLNSIQKDYIHKIESSSEHLLNLINDILDVSKIKAGELKIEKKEFNINDILEYVLNVTATKAKKNSVRLGLDVSHDVPAKIIGDSLRLGQVLINLIGNAVKFTHEGEVTLSVKKVSDFLDGIKLEFSISDTGIGMTEEQVGNIFHSYYQADDSTSRKFGGTGLGLSISKELVELMDGEIHVSSKKDVGTTFSFTVSLTLKDPENKRHYRIPSSSMLGKRILIVETSNKNVISLVSSLGYFNYITHAIPSFEDAVLDDTIQFDIVIINQYNLTSLAIKNIEIMRKVKGMKLVVLSDFYNAVDTKLIKNLKVDAFIQLPATQQSILNMIVELYVTKNLDKRSYKTTLKDKLKAMAKKKILVAEDNDVNQKVILGLLLGTGIELTFVDDGQEALDIVRKDIHFDLILMDISMPNMNGYEATAEIRKSSKYNTIPILALTGDVRDEAINKAIESGMQGHIGKPIILDIFYKKILDTLQTSSFHIKNDSTKSLGVLKSDDGYNELSLSVGLARCNGDSEFYRSILMDFKTMYSHSSTRLKSLCLDGKFREARRLAMDIKDVALNIGAYNVCESAATMEYEFEKGSRSNYIEFISSYESVLVKLFKEVDHYLKQDS